MNVAYTMAPRRGDTDLLLAGLAARCLAHGLRVCGTVQINDEIQDLHPCEMDVKVLPYGPVVRISQSLGREAKGCRLDPQALETAVSLVEAELQRDVDLLIINKFGKHEAEGRGFRDAIAEALHRGIPVIVGLNGLNRPAFLDFAGELALELAPEPAALVSWVQATTRPQPRVA